MSTSTVSADRARCSGCGRPLLRAGERKADVTAEHPDAVSPGRAGQCTTCYQRDQRAGRVSVGLCRACGKGARNGDVCARCAAKRKPAPDPLVPFPELDGTQACRDVDPEIFFPPESSDGAEAKAVCAVCPLRRPCLAFALTRPVEGVWGGTTNADRRRLRRRHRINTTAFPPAPGARMSPSTTGDPDDDQLA